MRHSIGFMVLIGSMAITAAYGQEKEKVIRVDDKKTEGGKMGEARDQDRVDISDIEKKYWSPKDTDFSVVQNRTYTKENKLFVSFGFGPIINDSYSEGYNHALTLNYFGSERFGVQVDYIKSDLKDNKLTKNLASFAGGAVPDFGRMSSYYGLGFNFVPFYAKMSLLGSRIIYFDMAVTPTVGLTEYEQVTSDGHRRKTSPTLGIDVTQYFFLARYFAIRLDLKNNWYREEIARWRTREGIPTGGKVRDEWNHTTLFLLGVSFFF